MAEDSVISKELEKAKDEGANLLMASVHIAGLSEFHVPVIERVFLSSKKEDGDVYAEGGGSDDDDDRKKPQKFRLTKQALMKLSVCTGVIWSIPETRRVDNGKDRNYVCYQAVGGLKKPDGTPVFFKAQYDIDFEVVEEELRESYAAKAKKWKKDAPYIDYCVKRDILQKRKHKLKLAEAGAMNRVIRELLSLKNAYTAEELLKPFVTVRIVFRPDYNDKDVKKALIDAHIKATTGIYGQNAIADAVQSSEPIDVIDVGKETEAGGNGSDDTAPDDKAAPSLESRVVDFQNSDVGDQIKTLESLAKQKRYDLAGYLAKAKKKSFSESEFEPNVRVDFFRHLLSLPDPVGGDVPPF